MNLDAAVSAFQQSLPECTAVGVVDLTTGTLLAVHTADNQNHAVLDLLVATADDVFKNTHVTSIDQCLRKARGDLCPDDGAFREVVLVSDAYVYVFQRGRQNEDTIVIAICHATANLGTVLARSRAGLFGIERAQQREVSVLARSQ
jgi:hypothetical protein